MLGPPKPRRLDLPIVVSLEDLVSQDNFYRHLEAKLDLGFVRDWTRELDAERGRLSIDPVVVFKLQYEAYLDRVHGYHSTESCRKTICKRQVWVEPLFAEAKE